MNRYVPILEFLEHSRNIASPHGKCLCDYQNRKVRLHAPKDKVPKVTSSVRAPGDDPRMLEMLWKTPGPHASVEAQEFYELHLVDLENAVRPRFLVRERHGSRSGRTNEVIWVGCEDEMFNNPGEAQRRYQTRRAAIVKAGFAYTDLITKAN
jgi:hypothetical protein